MINFEKYLHLIFQGDSMLAEGGEHGNDESYDSKVGNEVHVNSE